MESGQNRFLIKSRLLWVHSETGQVVSIFGAMPYSPSVSDDEKEKWNKVRSGFRIFDCKSMTTRGNGFETVEAASQWIENELSRLEGYKS